MQEEHKFMNQHFEQCRQLALEILKPSKAELTHGLELHQDALVWDAYGFAPSGECPGTLIDQMLEEGAGRDERITRYEQYLQVDFLRDPALFALYREAWELSGVDCVFQNAGVEGNSIPELLKRLSRFTYLPDRYPELYQRAAFPSQVEAAKAAGRRALYLTTNGVCLPDFLRSEEEALEQLTVFFQLGVRMMHLTYNRRNLIGDGCAEPNDGGLSSFGRNVVAAMNRTGIIPDVAHSGQRTSLEAALCSTKPVVASHTVAGALSKHYRGKSDEVIRAIVKSDGYVGVCAIPWFLRRSGMIDSLLDHIDYLVENFGAAHVAIGTDNGTRVGEVKPGLLKSKARPIFEQFWTPPIDPFDSTPEMMNSMTWTNWPLFTVGLVQRGHSDSDIRKILGGNVQRVASETVKGI